MNFMEMGLDERIVLACEELGYEKPTNVQLEVIPRALDGMDILADAPTGTGKTAAFLIPCLQHLIDFPKKKHGLARILILTPTRELALQIAQNAKDLTKFMPNIVVGTLIGGVQHEEQLSVISEKTDIVVATPGRLIEYLRKKAFDIRAVEILVLDEADRMLDMGFIDDVAEISEAVEKREQTMLFSATLEGDLLERFANEVLTNPVEIHIDSPRSERKKINQYKYYADDLEHKIKLLEALLSKDDIDKSIVFVKTRERLAELSRRLQKDGFEFVYIRGEMEQEKRIQAIERFTNNTVKILLATDVASRGLDITDITHVINFDLPRSADIYVHRIGRTARAGKKGSAISLIEAHDIPMLDRIEHYTNEEIALRVIDGLKHKNKIADFSKKKDKKEEDEKSKDKDTHKKERKRDKLNKGKPDFAKKRLKKLENVKADSDSLTVNEVVEKSAEQIAEARAKKLQDKLEKQAAKELKAKQTAEALAKIGKNVDLYEKASKKNKKQNEFIVYLDDDEEEYYDDDDIEMIEERKFQEQEKALKNNVKTNAKNNTKKAKFNGNQKDSIADKKAHLGSRTKAKTRENIYEDNELIADEEPQNSRFKKRNHTNLSFLDEGFGKDEYYNDYEDIRNRNHAYDSERTNKKFGNKRTDSNKSYRGNNKDNNKSSSYNTRDNSKFKGDKDKFKSSKRDSNKNSSGFANSDKNTYGVTKNKKRHDGYVDKKFGASRSNRSDKFKK